MSPRFSLRRSLCALLVAVTASAFSQAPLYYVDVSPFNSTLGSLVQTIAANTTTEVQFWNTLIFYLDTIASQNNGVSSQNFRDLCGIASNILTRCEVISDYDMQQVAQMRNNIVPKLEDCRSFLWNIRDYSSSLNNNLAALKQQLQGANFTNDLSGITSDIEDVSQNIQSLVSLFTSFGNSLSSIESTLSTLDNVTSNTFVSAFSELFGKFDALPDTAYWSTEVESIVSAINRITDGLGNSVQVDGTVDVSSSSFAPVVNAVNWVRQSVYDFSVAFQTWIGNREENIPNYMNWGVFTERMSEFFINFSRHLAYQENIYAILQDLNTNYNEYNTFYTNSLATYLPYLTNGFDSAFLNVLSNNLSNIPLFSGDPAWSITSGNISYYNLARFLGGLLANEYHQDGISVGTFVPGAPNDSLVRRFFQRGGPSQQTVWEKAFGQYSAQMDDQRRYIYSISNTVPYIEGLPYRKASLSDDGDGWLGAWGNYNWNTDGDTISLIEDSRNGGHTPWNNGYFSTDYFADLLKFIARTNLLQDAAYYNAMLGLFGATNGTVEEVEEPNDLEWTDPTDVQAEIDELPDSDSILPTEFMAIESREYDSFASDASSKLRVAFDNPVSQISDSIVLFPSVPSIRSYSTAVGSPQLLHFEDYMTASDRRTIHDIFAIMWRLIYYVFAVWKVTDLIKTFFAST